MQRAKGEEEKEGWNIIKGWPTKNMIQRYCTTEFVRLVDFGQAKMEEKYGPWD